VLTDASEDDIEMSLGNQEGSGRKGLAVVAHRM
jgi:hypothetical protein